MQLAQLQAAVSNSGAFRLYRRLQAAGGPGSKVFPPTYEGGTYAKETRVIDGQRLPCVLLDSVASQANRMELALQSAIDDDRIGMPHLSVDFTGHDLAEPRRITSLEAPHRNADAIIRDSLLDGKTFNHSHLGKALDTAANDHATPLFATGPHCLLMGLWHSTGSKGGMGAKFPRAITSEIVAVDAEVGVKPSSRIDPAKIQREAGPLYHGTDRLWTLDPEQAKKEKGKPLPMGKDGRPSEANHGNIAPSLSDTGGVTMAYAHQHVVISCSALRRLRFPLGDGPSDPTVDNHARTVLAALGLLAVTLADRDSFLRSGCDLEPEGTAEWKILGPGEEQSFSLTEEDAIALFTDAVESAKKAGLPWETTPVTLQPSAELVELIKRSQAIAAQTQEA